MHFWIDKPAGRYYGFGGRRYPATPLPKARSGHRRRGREVIRPMVTPVHRFQSLNGTSHAPGPSNSCGYGPRHLRPSLRNANDIGANNNSENISLQPVQATANSANCHVSDNAGNNQLHPPSETAADPAHNRSLLDFSEFTDAELAGCRLRCGVWITCVLAAGFVVAAKFYFDHQGTGLEVLVYCGLLVTLLLSGCFYSILCRRTEENVVRENAMQSQEDPIAAMTAANTIANENIRLPMVMPVSEQNPPPPPYHIAILIPPSHSAEDIPPPSYDKIAVH
ncbi:uncharacterized protein [Neodiprion pinetum]|uniref:uncharacterized protein LOC124183405 n=1 Tax=Neodiprion fabricii TaxID=2872261 RepID=UPI001ED9414F|nr:uncharacterized protein LOC124183405 [Neodiprion fabricii]XP_046481195.1 uncharacterized protein LOC124218616 [Neodiprion pinetum]XP_046481196.1 uncharacterized protein LOC124218616 [Neodiprion pinetum]XP_046481197.1 uncharacterized protein LOC124218616 [Neodiprion pinetum]